MTDKKKPNKEDQNPNLGWPDDKANKNKDVQIPTDKRIEDFEKPNQDKSRDDDLNEG